MCGSFWRMCMAGVRCTPGSGHACASNPCVLRVAMHTRCVWHVAMHTRCVCLHVAIYTLVFVCVCVFDGETARAARGTRHQPRGRGQCIVTRPHHVLYERGLGRRRPGHILLGYLAVLLQTESGGRLPHRHRGASGRNFACAPFSRSGRGASWPPGSLTSRVCVCFLHHRCISARWCVCSAW